MATYTIELEDGGRAEITTEADLTEPEEAALRVMYRTRADITAALTLGQMINDAVSA